MKRELVEALLKKPHIAKLNEHNIASISNPHFNSRPIAFVESTPVDVSLGKAQLQKAGSKSFRVCVCSVRRRLIDEDNLSAKYLVDQLRYAGLLPDDNPALCKIEVTQRKCTEGEEEHVEIEISVIQ